MFMCFRGGGIGHKALRPIEDLLDGANVETSEVAGNSENVANTPIEDPAQSDEDEDEGESDDERELSDEEALGPEDGEDGEDLEENPAY